MKNGSDEVTIECLDDVFANEKVTYIKYDIEGAEMSALKGSKKVIQRDKPSIHISIYHRPEDLYEIPLFLKELVPEYKYKIIHRTTLPFDTDLFAYIDGKE